MRGHAVRVEAEWGYAEAPSVVWLLEQGGGELLEKYLRAHPEEVGRVQDEMRQLDVLGSSGQAPMHRGARQAMLDAQRAAQEASAMAIQGGMRGRAGRGEAMDAQRAEQEASAMAIQGGMRGRAGRQAVADAQMEVELDGAASTVQVCCLTACPPVWLLAHCWGGCAGVHGHEWWVWRVCACGVHGVHGAHQVAVWMCFPVQAGMQARLARDQVAVLQRRDEAAATVQGAVRGVRGREIAERKARAQQRMSASAARTVQGGVQGRAVRVEAEWGYAEAPSVVWLLEQGGGELLEKYLRAHPEEVGRVQDEMRQLDVLGSSGQAPMHRGARQAMLDAQRAAQEASAMAIQGGMRGRAGRQAVADAQMELELDGAASTLQVCCLTACPPVWLLAHCWGGCAGVHGHEWWVWRVCACGVHGVHGVYGAHQVAVWMCFPVQASMKARLAREDVKQTNASISLLQVCPYAYPAPNPTLILSPDVQLHCAGYSQDARRLEGAH